MTEELKLHRYILKWMSDTLRENLRIEMTDDRNNKQRLGRGHHIAGLKGQRSWKARDCRRSNKHKTGWKCGLLTCIRSIIANISDVWEPGGIDKRGGEREEDEHNEKEWDLTVCESTWERLSALCDSGFTLMNRARSISLILRSTVHQTTRCPSSLSYGSSQWEMKTVKQHHLTRRQSSCAYEGCDLTSYSCGVISLSPQLKINQHKYMN